MAQILYKRPQAPYVVEVKKGKTLLFVSWNKTATGARKAGLYFMRTFKDTKASLNACIYMYHYDYTSYKPRTVIHKKVGFINFFDLRDIPNY